MKKTICLWFGILFIVNSSVIAQVLTVKQHSVSLGVVNGDLVNGQIEIKKVLSNSTLLVVNQRELEARLESLSIKNATLLKNQQGDVTILVDAGNQISTKITLSLWLDGKKIDFDSSQSGSSVQLKIPVEFELLEVKTMTALTINLPKSYRGGFDFTLDMEGWRL